jgi:hypothetical protein
MELLNYKYYDAYIIQVSSNNIGLSWKKFRVRANNKPTKPEDYCSYTMHSDGVLTIYNAEKESYEEIPEDKWGKAIPVFFEDHKYSISITFFDAIEEPKVIHPNKEVEAMFICTKIDGGKYLISSTIDFINQPGYFELEFSYMNKASQQIQHKLGFDVLSPKLDTKYDLNIIIRQLRARYGELVFKYLSLTFQQFEKGNETNNELIWLQVFKQIINNYVLSVQFILHQPHNKMIELEEYRRAERIKMWNPSVVMQFVNDRLIDEQMALHKYYRTERVESTTDTRENRFVKYTLERISERLKLIADKLTNDTSDSEKNFLNEKYAELQMLRQNSLFRGIGRFEGFRQQSMILQQRSGYSQIYQYWLLLQNGLDLIHGETSIGVQPIWKLYELWCFLKMKQLVCSVLGIDPMNKEHIEKYIHEDIKDTYDLFNGGSLRGNVTYINPQNSDKIELGYQYSFNRNSAKDEMRSATTEQQPDIVMHIHKHNQDITLTYLYDAKYRVRGDEDSTVKSVIDEPVADTINAMHHYRDAIYYGKRGEQKFSKEVIGGYILFPGRLKEKEMLEHLENNDNDIPYYLSSINEINIGAFPLLPNEDDGRVDNEYYSGLLLENHLRKVLLEETTLQQLEISVPQRGLVYTDDPNLSLAKKWNRTKVLVFIDTNSTHWGKINSIDSVAIGIENDLHAFNVVKNFTKAKFVVVTNSGKDEKFKVKLFKVKGEPDIVDKIDKDNCISITYTNPTSDSNANESNTGDVEASAFIKYTLDIDAVLPSVKLSRDKIENTKPDGEDRHRPRVVKMINIIES